MCLITLTTRFITGGEDPDNLPEGTCMTKFIDLTGTETEIDMASIGEPETWHKEREGHRDLCFKGWKLGVGENGSGGNSGYRCDWTRGVRVGIYLTVGGKFVLCRNYWSNWQGETSHREAAIYDSVQALYDGLTDDENRLQTAEKEAFEKMCATLDISSEEMID